MVIPRQQIAYNKARFIPNVLIPMLTVMLGYSAASAAVDKKAPTKPSNFRVTATTAYSFSVAWGPSTDNSGNYTYFLADTASPSERVTLMKSATSFTFTRGLYPRHSYTAIIQAVDAAGNYSSPIGVGVTLHADTTPPSTAPVISVTELGARHISLAWSPPQDDAPFLYYEIFLNGSPYRDAGTNLAASL